MAGPRKGGPPYVQDQYCKCPQSPPNILTVEQFINARDGNIEPLRTWLRNGGSDRINMVESSAGRTMLMVACYYGRTEVLTELLMYHDIHLNILHHGKTPLAWAALNGHEKCVQLILESSVQCRPDLTGAWDKIADILRRNPGFIQKNNIYILSQAVLTGNSQFVDLIVHDDFIFTSDEIIPVLHKAYERDQWEIMFTILRRNFYHKVESLNYVLFRLINERIKNWSRISDVLEILDKNISVDKPLTEAALYEKEDEFMQLIKEKKNDPNILGGTLLITAAGGASHVVSSFLLENDSVKYSQSLLQNALFMAAKKDNLEMLPLLLQFNSSAYSYQGLSSAHKAAAEAGHKNAERLLERALTLKAENLLKSE